MSRAILLLYAEEERKKKRLINLRRQMRDSSNPLLLPDRKFIARFRLSKVAFDELCREVIPRLPATQRTTAIRNELKILAALSFYAHGSHQRRVGASYLHNMSQPSLSKCIEEVTEAINSKEILLKYIKFPTQRAEREAIIQDFMHTYGFPGIIGCIDSTHVAIMRPVDHEEAYCNQRGYYSLNVLSICDGNLNILHVDASFGGASHDSFVWSQSPIKAYLEEINAQNEQCWLLGDSGYAQRSHMMTPILGAVEGSPEDYYTKLHNSILNNVVEGCFGALKARWRCLLAQRMLHYSPAKAGKLVNACVVLHNIANAHSLPVPSLSDEDYEALQTSDHHLHITTSESPPELRSMLVERLWAARNA